jgi:transaldolase
MKIYADGATLEDLHKLKDNPIVQGYTFNPSLLRKTGVIDFEGFAKEFLSITKLPVSLEVFSDNWDDMEREARIMASWGENVYIKIPPFTTKGIYNTGLIESLLKSNIKLNLTCIFTYAQIHNAIRLLEDREGIISIFAGRIADAGYSPENFIAYAHYNKCPKQEVLWASTRELSNIKQAEDSGADIITMDMGLINKLDLIGKDLIEFSKDTVKMFHDDAVKSGYKL